MTQIETLIFNVQGSAKEPYSVKFQRHAGRVAASCTCPAGIFQDLCKHRLQILNGTCKDIVSSNAAEAVQIPAWIVGTEVAAALAEMLNIESQIEQLKKQLNNVKKTVAQVMA